MVKTVLDLRSNTKAGVANDPIPGMGLFQDDTGNLVVGPWQWRVDPDEGTGKWHAPLSTAGYLTIADPGATMGVGDRNAFANLLQIAPGLFQGGSFTNILVNDVLGSLADPTGVARVKPLRISPTGLTLDARTLGRIFDEPFSPSHPHFGYTLAVRFADYRKSVLAGESQEQLEKETGSDMIKYHRRRGDNLLSLFVPPEYLDGTLGTHGQRAPATTRLDDFNRANDATGLGTSSEGWAWTNVVNHLEILSNEAEENDDAESRTRAEGTLSSTDHFVRCDVTQMPATAGRAAGPAGRFAAAADEYYLVRLRYAGSSSNYRLEKKVASVVTELDFSIGEAFPTLPITVSIVLDTNSQIGLAAGLQPPGGLSATDTAITTGVRGGLQIRGTAGTSARVDNFQAEDTATIFAFSQAVIIG